jgi:hypothetical protein
MDMSAPEHIRAASVELKPLGDGRVLAIRTGASTGQIVLSDLAGKAIQLCRGFREAGFHEEQLSRALHQSPDAVRAVLAELRRHHLLEDQQSWVSRYGVAAGEGLARTPISTVGVVTRQTEGRWSTLDRCLGSIAAKAREYGHADGLRILIADDADSPAIRETVRARLANWRRGFPEVDVQYFGHEEKAALSAQAGPGLRFVLTGAISGEPLPAGAISTGANRNTLLYAAGRTQMICVDDDVHWNGCYRSGEGFKPGLRLDSKLSFDEPLLMFENPAGKLKHDPCDLLAECGKPFGSIPSGDIDWATTELDAADWTKLERGQARVRIAQIGLAGDCGGASPITNLMQMGRVATSLSEEQYRKLVLSRHELRVASQWTASHAKSIMSYCVALDNRSDTLPPFAPLGRNQDGVFGGLLRAIDAFAFTGFAPVAICHEPPEVRGYAPESLSTLPPMMLSDIVMMLVESLSAGVYSHRDGLAKLGEWLETLAQAPPKDYEQLIKTLRTKALEQFIQILEQTLKMFGSKPAFWVRDMQKLLRVVESHMASPQVGEVRERGAVWDTAAQQRYLEIFARGLQEWHLR